MIPQMNPYWAFYLNRQAGLYSKPNGLLKNEWICTAYDEKRSRNTEKIFDFRSSKSVITFFTANIYLDTQIQSSANVSIQHLVPNTTISPETCLNRPIKNLDLLYIFALHKSTSTYYPKLISYCKIAHKHKKESLVHNYTSRNRRTTNLLKNKKPLVKLLSAHVYHDTQIQSIANNLTQNLNPEHKK